MVLNAIFEFPKSPNLSPFQIPFLGIVGIPRADSEAIIPRKRRVAHTTLPETCGIGVFLVPGSIMLLSASWLCQAIFQVSLPGQVQYPILTP